MGVFITLSERIEIEEENLNYGKTEKECLTGIIKYNKMLEEYITDNYFVGQNEFHYLNRFAPYDLKGNILKKPELEGKLSDKKYLEYYDKHLDKVWFKGFKIFPEGDSYSLEYCGYPYLLKNIARIKFFDELRIELTPFGDRLAGYEYDPKNSRAIEQDISYHELNDI